jgi:L-threonylcarbamoyladenylate synthase
VHPDDEGPASSNRRCVGAQRQSVWRPTPAAEEAGALGETVALILDGGRCPGGQPSTVVDASGDSLTIVRLGPIDEEMLYQALGH